MSAERQASLAPALLLFGALTVVAAGKHAIEGAAAFLVVFAVATPPLLWYLHRLATAVAAIAGLLVIVTFVVGGVTGSTAAADATLGCVLALLGGAVGSALVAACGLAMATAAVVLGAAAGAPDAAIALSTGTLMLAAGGIALARRPPAAPARGFGPLTRHDRRAAATLCAAAFLDDPAMSALEPRARRRARMLQWWFRGLLPLAAAVAGRSAHAAFDAGRPVAVAVAYEPNRFPPSVWATQLAAPGPLVAGPRALVRALRWAAAREHGHPTEPHLYLETLATEPSHQGLGLGAALLRRLCSEADDRDLPIVLYTNTERAVGFYERFGFRVIRRTRLPHGPLEWTMERPRSPAPRSGGSGAAPR